MLNLQCSFQVIDLGCAECKFLQLATKESYIEELCGVDINGELLQSSCHRVQPMVSDYLHPRSNMLNVQLFQVHKYILFIYMIHFITNL